MFEDVCEVVNERGAAIAVVVEPWASEYALAPGQALRLVGRSARAGRWELVDGGGAVVTAYAWEGATAEVTRDGALIDALRVAVPEVPPGRSLRAFVEGLFGATRR